MNIETYHKNQGPIDLEDANGVTILIRDDGKTMWINTTLGCLVRLCRIKGTIKIEDKRIQRKKK